MNFVNALREQARQAYCVFLNSQIVAGTAANQLVGLPGDAVLDLLNNVSRAVCNREPANPPNGGNIPFTGGQCANLDYRVDMKTTEVYDGNQVELRDRTYFPRLQGVIGAIRLIPEGVGVAAGTGAQVQILYGVGTLPAPGGAGVLASALIGSFPPSRQNYCTIDEVRLVALDRATGNVLPPGSDNCGNPPAPPPPAPSAPIVRNVTYTNVNNQQVTVPVTFVFSPITGTANLNVEVPVTFSFTSDVTFSGTINVSTGDFNFTFNGEYTNNEGDRENFFPPSGSGDGDGDLEEVTQIVTEINTTTNEITNKIDNIENNINNRFDEAKVDTECIESLIRALNTNRIIGTQDQELISIGIGDDLDTVVSINIAGRTDLIYTIELELTNDFHGRLYKFSDDSDDVEGGFGNICFGYGGGSEGVFGEGGLQLLYLKKTSLVVPNPLILPDTIRLSLKAGIGWTVIARGVVLKSVILPEC